MTFIARQLDALQEVFDVSALTRARRNPELFPFKELTVVPRTLPERLQSRVRHALDQRDWSLNRNASKRLGSAIDQVRPDIIHAHFGPSGLSILPLAQANGIPLVVTFHGFDASYFLSRRAYLDDLPRLFSYANIVTVSEEMRLRLIQLGAEPERTHCCYIGVPVENYFYNDRETLAARHARGDKIRFLQVANFVEKKGHYTTIKAFAKLLESVPNCELVLAGDGPLRPAMEALASSLTVSNAVRFLGHQDTLAVARLMRDADCFIHHSVTAANGDMEGIPTVLMEAMASGLPVLSTRHAGIPELVTEAVDGLLVDERDVTAQAAAMLSVLSDRGDMGRRARTKIEQCFDIRRCSLQLAELMNMLREPIPSRRGDLQ